MNLLEKPGITQTAQLTMSKIRRILALIEQIGQEIRQALKTSYNSDLLRLMFAQPYLKTGFWVQKNLAHRQTAAMYLKKLAEADILTPNPIGRTTYYVN